VGELSAKNLELARRLTEDLNADASELARMERGVRRGNAAVAIARGVAAQVKPFQAVVSNAYDAVQAAAETGDFKLAARLFYRAMVVQENARAEIESALDRADLPAGLTPGLLTRRD
jgi:uncharacterized protein (DUF2342 family)